MSTKGFLNGHLLREALEGVLALKLFKLGGSVLVKELIDRQEATTNTDVNTVHINTNDNALCSELVDALGFTHEHDLELLAVGVVVDVLSKALVNSIVLHGDVDGNARLKVDDVLLESLNFVD